MPELDVDDLYDWAEVDVRSSSRPRSPRRTTRRGSVVLAAALWAVDDVVMGQKRREPVVEESPDPGLDRTLPVVVHLVRGQPALSSAVIRARVTVAPPP